MKRLRNILLGVLILLVVLIAAALVGLNLYVQSPGARARIQAQLSETIGIPLEITNVSVGWTGARVNGIRIPDGERNFLEANSFSADYQLLPLLSKRLVIDRMVLDAPKVLWAQNAEGKWILPVLPEKARKEQPVLPNTPKPPSQPSTFQVSLDKLEIVNGSIELRDAQQNPIAIASDVQMRYTLRTAGRVEGNITAKKVVWQDAITFADVESPLVFTQGEFSLPALKANAAGGPIEANVTVQTEAKDSPFKVDLNFSDVDLAKVSAEGGWDASQAGGRVGGKLALHGTLKRLNRTEGDGEVSLADGQFKQLNLFQTIGVILQIPELSDLRVRTGKANFRIKDEKTYINELVLEAPNLQFSTKGNVRFDGKLSLDAQLAISTKLAQQLPTFVRSNFSEPDAAGRQSIAFDITGKTDKPKTNLVDRIIGKRVNAQLDNLLESIFVGRKKGDGKDEKKEKKKKKDEPTTEPTSPVEPSAAAGTPSPAAPAPAREP